MPLRTRALPALVGAVSGLLYCLSLPKADQGWLAWICLIPCLLLLLQDRRPLSLRSAAVVGLSSGLVAGLGRVYWVAETLELYGDLDASLALLTTAFLILYVAAYPTLFVVLCRRLPRASHAWPWLTASLWDLLDWVQTWMISGFPWELLGYTQYRYPAVAQLAAFGGVHGITFLIVLVNSAIAQALVVRRARVVAPVTASLLLLICLGAGSSRLTRLESEQSSTGVRVGIVQGNIGQDKKWQARADSTTHHYDRLTRDLARAQGPLDLIVWPETALPFRLDSDSNRCHLERVRRLAQETATPLLVGSLGSRSPSGQRGLYNRSFLIDSDGTARGSADKVHLVPFGEYLPLRWLFGYLKKLTLESGRFDAGEDHVVLPVPGAAANLGVFICYESIFPAITRALVQRGADVLVNTTNDAWFGTSAAPQQHLAMAVVRAVETGRPVVRAANTGISCVIEPSGRIRQATDLFVTTTVTATVLPRTELTPYTRWGDWIFVLSAALLGVATATAQRRRNVHLRAQIEAAVAELTAFARQPVPLSRPLVLLPGYDSHPERWSTFRRHLAACFTNAGQTTWIDLARDESIPELTRRAVLSLPEETPRDYLGHSLGALVAVELAQPGDRVFALAVPIDGTRLADFARWARFPFPRLLLDLSPGSDVLCGLRSRIQQMPGWIGLRLSGDPLSNRPSSPLAGSHRDYAVPALVSPWHRHRCVHADPRVVRDVIAALRTGTVSE